MKRLTLFLSILLAAGMWSPLAAQKKPNKPKQYKKLNRDRITDLAQGRTEAAVTYFEKYLEAHPKDLEAKYGLAIGYAMQGNMEKSKAMMERSIEEGLPFTGCGPIRYLRRERTRKHCSSSTRRPDSIRGGPISGNVRYLRFFAPFKNASNAITGRRLANY